MCWLVGWLVVGGRSVETSSGTNVVSRGRLGRVFCPLGRRLVSFWGSAEVICAPLWLKGCHDEARCGQVRARRADGCARTSETHIKPICFDDFWKPLWAPGNARNRVLHIFARYFNGFRETCKVNTSEMLKFHWFLSALEGSREPQVIQPDEKVVRLGG